MLHDGQPVLTDRGLLETKNGFGYIGSPPRVMYLLGWSAFLRGGAALTERFGDRVGHHYDWREDPGLF